MKTDFLNRHLDRLQQFVDRAKSNDLGPAGYHEYKKLLESFMRAVDRYIAKPIDWYEAGVWQGSIQLKSNPQLFHEMLEQNRQEPSDEAQEFYQGLLQAQKEFNEHHHA